MLNYMQRTYINMRIKKVNYYCHIIYAFSIYFIVMKIIIQYIIRQYIRFGGHGIICIIVLKMLITITFHCLSSIFRIYINYSGQKWEN